MCSTYIFHLYSSYPICSSLPTSCHPFYVTHQTATSHYVLTTSSAVDLLQSTNAPFLPPIRLFQNSFFCQCSCPNNMLYILLHGHISNACTSNIFKMYKSVFSHNTLARSTPEIFIIIFFVLSDPLSAIIFF